MAADTRVEKNSNLRRVVRREMHKVILAYLIIGLVCIAVTFFFEGGKKICEDKNAVINESVEEMTFCANVKKMLLGHMGEYCNLVMTLNTILAAAVIFFYSIQDSRKGGIPHRVILAYTLGSFTVPILFIITLLMLPFCYLTYSLNMNWTVSISLIFIFFIQLIIVAAILTSTSYQFGVYAITNAEIRQFQALHELEEEREKGESGGIHKVKTEHDPFFSWTYLQHHMVEVTVSGELAVDKLLMTRRILRAPYYQREIKLREELLETKIGERIVKESASVRRIKISAEKLESNNLKKLYEFYYGNLLEVFKQINQPDDLEYRNKVYLVLYEFLEELTELYENELPDRMRLEDDKKNYAMTVAGIINAVLSGNTEEAEAFCNYIFNNVISKDTWNTQISLYILFQQYLYRTDTNGFRIKNLNGIRAIEGWENKIEEDQEMYELFWDIWMEYTTVLQHNSYLYYAEALRAFAGKGDIVGPVAYAMRCINGRKVSTYENKSGTNAQ